MKNILIIIPAYREDKNILKLSEKLLNLNNEDLNLKLFIVDDSDNLLTQNLLLNSKLRKKIIFIKRAKKSGRGSAVIRGMKYFLNNRNHFSCIVEMDADFSHNPTELKRNLNYFFSKKTDLLIASRYLSKSKIINWPISRKILSYLSNKLAKFLLGVPVSDYTNGYRIYSYNAVNCCLKNCGKIGDGFIILSEFLLSIYKNKLKINEIHTTFINRVRGESSVSRKEIINSLIGLFKLYMIKVKFKSK